VDEPEMKDLLVRLDLLVDDGYVYVGEAAKSLEDPWQSVQTAIFYLLKWTRFIEMRWCGAGRSCKLLTRSWARGSEALATYVLPLQDVNTTHLGGIRRATLEVKLLAVIAAFSAGPAETLNEALFEDDKLLAHGQEYRERMDHEIHYFAGI